MIANTGAEPDRLAGANSPAAEKVEIHAIKVTGGDIGMRARAEGLAVPAGVTLTLQPRGYHLLLLGLRTPPMPGASLPVTLILEKAGSIDADKLRPALETVEIDSIKGRVAMRACDHQAVQQGFMVKVGRKDGFKDPIPELIATFPADQITPACRQMTYDS